MNKSGLLLFLMLAGASVLPAQPMPGGGPRPGPWGRGGGGPDLGLIFAGPGSRTPVTGAPYSGVQTTQMEQKFADGNQISRQETSKVYRDSQGRVRTERTVTPPGATTAETRITIFDPVGGFSYVLNPADNTAVKMPVHAPPANAPAMPGDGPGGPPNAQKQTETLPAQNVNGVAATGTRTTVTIPAGAIGNHQGIQIVREVWISTALKVPVQIKSSDPRFGSTTMNLANIVQGEHDPALFQVPGNYTITTRGNGRGAGASSGRGMGRGQRRN